jgi:hypothetical protein
MTSEIALVSYSIENQIHLVRGQKVLLDSDLAALYEVEVRALIQAVKRNEKRFPSDFVFQLTAEENEALRSQTVISKNSRGGRRYAPYAFTEHGAIMAASVLNSPRALEMSMGDEHPCGSRLPAPARDARHPQGTRRQTRRIGTTAGNTRQHNQRNHQGNP